MMKKDVSLSDIRTFVVLAEAGSFTKAAEQLMCSRSFISKQLAQLETDLGVSLLVRTTRTQHLTEQGVAFFERCKQSLAGIDFAVDRVKESALALSGEIKVNSVGGIIGEQLVAPLITQFMTLYPGVNMLLDFASPRVDLIADEFDFVFRMGELQDSSLIARKLTELNNDLYASPDYLAKYGYPQTPKDLTLHRCITGSMQSWNVIHRNSKHRTELNVRGELVCKSGRVMLSSALAGNGIIRVPELYCRPYLADGLLVPVFADWYLEPTPLYLVYAKDKHQASRLKLFKQFVLDNWGKSRET